MFTIFFRIRKFHKIILNISPNIKNIFPLTFLVIWILFFFTGIFCIAEETVSDISASCLSSHQYGCQYVVVPQIPKKWGHIETFHSQKLSLNKFFSGNLYSKLKTHILTLRGPDSAIGAHKLLESRWCRDGT